MYSTPILHGAPPIRTLVHCYSNHGAHLGAHHVAMETASVYNRAKESRTDSEGEITTRLLFKHESSFFITVAADAGQTLRLTKQITPVLKLFNKPSK